MSNCMWGKATTSYMISSYLNPNCFTVSFRLLLELFLIQLTRPKIYKEFTYLKHSPWLRSQWKAAEQPKYISHSLYTKKKHTQTRHIHIIYTYCCICVTHIYVCDIHTTYKWKKKIQGYTISLCTQSSTKCKYLISKPTAVWKQHWEGKEPAIQVDILESEDQDKK